MIPFIFLFLGLDEVLGNDHIRRLAGPGQNGAVWADYPAYSLSIPPRAALKPGKKQRGPPPPLFDIMVEPEYIPDPFPVPYPFPMEEPPSPMQPPPHEEIPMRRPKYKKTQYTERAEVEWNCPKDFIEEGPHCVKLDQVERQLGCASGWKFEHGSCKSVDVKPPELVCDQGYRPWENDKECVKEIQAPKEMHCPGGFEGSIEGCMRGIETPPQVSCEDGQLLGNKCHKTLRARPAISCPHDFTLSPDGVNCFRETVIPGALICPAGNFALLSNGDCERKMVMTPQAVCPTGFNLIGNMCTMESHERPSRTCENGRLVDNHCLSVVDQIPSQLECPNGFSMDGTRAGSCSRLSQMPPTIACSKGFLLEGNHCIQKTYGKDKKKKGPGIDPTKQCGPGYALSTDGIQCTSLEEVSPVTICPDDYIPQEGQCIRKVKEPAVLVCPGNTVLHQGLCIEVHTVPPKLICQPGSYLGEDKSCVYIENKPGATKCPHGFDNINPGHCKKVERQEPTYSCPHTMTARHHVAQYGTVCEGDEIIEPDVACPVEGMHLEVTSKGYICRGMELEAPAFNCPAKFHEDNNFCIKYEVHPKRQICPSTYTLSFGTCIKTVDRDPVILCPQGYDNEQEAGMCIRRRKADKMPICPNYMEFDRLVGECYRVKVQYDFDNGDGDQPPQEAELPLEVPTPATLPPTTTTTPMILQAPMQMPVQAPMPPPQITMIQQPVILPQPAIILPQQAPIPPPPAIRVPYGVPEPVPVFKKPKHQTVIQPVLKTTEVILP